MEKKRGRKIPHDDLFEETHLKKKKNSTDEDVWVEPRAKAAHDKYRLILNEFRSSHPLESQGDSIHQHVEEELWEQAMGPAVVSHFYGYHKKNFGENVRSSFGPTSSYTSLVDREIIESLKNTISKLTEELVEQRGRAEKKEEEISSQNKMLQEQFSSFIQTADIIPPCPCDAVRAAKGLRLLDDINTDKDAKDEDDDDDDEY
ncbi:hypothetical protein P3S68_004796 [Capsicum galapagoense]